jgi:hypothetical protein
VNSARWISFDDRSTPFSTNKTPQYTWLSAAPGKYRIAIVPLNFEWGGEAAAASTLDIEKGRNYFVKVAWRPKPDPTFLEGLVSPLIEPIVGRKRYSPPGLIYLSETEAMDVMIHARFVDPIK